MADDGRGKRRPWHRIEMGQRDDEDIDRQEGDRNCHDDADQNPDPRRQPYASGAPELSIDAQLAQHRANERADQDADAG
jgi:hypothetical protein